ncbi:MAG: acyloxyacyl hydrolase [Sphingobacteriaceae bacterium]|nr:acyloxyacyl hydrolase [Sphingobacteriaceae bacterium]
MKKRHQYCLFLLLSSIISFSQNGVTDNHEWFIKPAYNHGFILEHRSNIGHLVKGYPFMAEIAIGSKTMGHKLWHCENNLPDIGVAAFFIDFRNPSQLGYAYALAPFADIPLNTENKKARVIMRLCWGLTYLTKSFDIHSNPKNVAIGSHLNSFVQFKWYWHLQLSKNLRFEPGFSFSHASNARAEVPNLGLNVVTLNAGFNYTIPTNKPKEIRNVDSLCRVLSRNELLIYSAFGYNQREVDGEYLYCGLLSMEYHRNKRNTHKFGGGIDVFIDQNYLADYKQEFNKSATGIENTRIALKFCYSYNIGRVSFPIDVGYYVFHKTKPDGDIVSRIGMKYYSRSGLVFNLGLRTHFAVAYNFEYGLGYRFFLQKKK